VRGFGWFLAVSRRLPISLSTTVACAEGYTYAAQVWALSIVQGPLSVAPCQTSRFATLFFAVRHPTSTQAAVALRAPGCCDVTASLSHGGQIEYDVPRCAADTPREECVYTVVTYQYIDGPQSMFPHKQGGTPAAAPDRSSLDRRVCPLHT
jgi:hypothetical protein